MIRIKIDKPSYGDLEEPTAPEIARIVERALKDSGLRVTEIHLTSAIESGLMATVSGGAA
jgi:hypothetical protein